MADAPHIAIQIEQERIAINAALARKGYQMAIFIVDHWDGQRDSDYELQAFNESDMNDDDAMAVAYVQSIFGHPIFLDLMSFLERHAPCEFHRINNFMMRRCIVRNIKMRED